MCGCMVVVIVLKMPIVTSPNLFGLAALLNYWAIGCVDNPTHHLGWWVFHEYSAAPQAGFHGSPGRGEEGQSLSPCKIYVLLAAGPSSIGTELLCKEGRLESTAATTPKWIALPDFTIHLFVELVAEHPSHPKNHMCRLESWLNHNVCTHNGCWSI